MIPVIALTQNSSVSQFLPLKILNYRDNLLSCSSILNIDGNIWKNTTESNIFKCLVNANTTLGIMYYIKTNTRVPISGYHKTKVRKILSDIKLLIFLELSDIIIRKANVLTISRCMLIIRGPSSWYVFQVIQKKINTL